MEQTAETTQGGQSEPLAERPPGANAVRVWLLATALLVLAMVLLGGATRLTDSGLSITEWQPIIGAIPPLSEAHWQEAFDKYRQIPEYQQVNRGMSLAEFKVIYWWEWAHRFLGRLIGIVFAVPFFYFWLRGRLERSLAVKLLLVLVLGALQGLMGWYMVMSGLVHRVDVSQYRLAAHLILAAAIFGALLWLVFGLDGQRSESRGSTRHRPLMLSAIGLCALIFLQIALGAFVAGMDAGLAYNTWPLMGDEFVPGGLLAMEPWYLNPFENATTVQFDHRMVAYLMTIWAVLHAFSAMAWGGEATRGIRSAAWLAALVLLQAASGIATLVWFVPMGMALIHQAGAFIVFGLAFYHLYCLTGSGQAVGLQPAAA